MAAKNNIRSIRFSDELAALIEQQPGESFTAKLEFLITKCVWELPEKEKELERLKEQCENERERLRKLRVNIQKWEAMHNRIYIQIKQLEETVTQEIKKCNTI